LLVEGFFVRSEEIHQKSGEVGTLEHPSHVSIARTATAAAAPVRKDNNAAG
jgi:hypothetical protein